MSSDRCPVCARAFDDHAVTCSLAHWGTGRQPPPRRTPVLELAQVQADLPHVRPVKHTVDPKSRDCYVLFNGRGECFAGTVHRETAMEWFDGVPDGVIARNGVIVVWGPWLNTLERQERYLRLLPAGISRVASREG